jgi:hypothetical protein
MGRRPRRFDSHPHLGLGRRKEAAPRAAVVVRGGGVRRLGGEGEVAGEVRGCDEEWHRLFIRRARQWSSRD